jgi:hypothetical protein
MELKKAKYYIEQTPHEPRTPPAGWDAFERGGDGTPVRHFPDFAAAKAWLHEPLEEHD